MARRRSYRNRLSNRRTARREVFNSNPFANLLPRSPARYYSINDFRTFHPEGALRPHLRPSGRTARFSRPTVRLSSGASPRRLNRALQSHQLYFSAPKSVITCVRRKQRKEVMHALGKAGRRGQRRPRRSERSQIIC